MRIKVCGTGSEFLELPAADAELNSLMRRIGVGGTSPWGRLVKAENGTPLKLLEGKTLNMDEVNYFAKRMESLTEYEEKVLYAYAAERHVDNMKDLINLTFSMQGLSLITDFSDAEQVGKRLWLDEFTAIGEKEKDETDFTEFANKTLRENHTDILMCGILVEHGFELREVYNGKTFPEYDTSAETVATVEVRSWVGDTEYLYLPTDICSVNKVKERLLIMDCWEMNVTRIDSVRLPDSLVPKPKDIDSVETLTLFNEMCQTVKNFNEAEMKRLGMVVEFTGLNKFTEVTSIAKSFSDFEVNPSVHNDEEYGKYLVEESGMVKADEILYPYIDYDAFARDKRDGTMVRSGYTDRGFVGMTKEMQAYTQYGGEFADPLGIDEDSLETFRLYSPLRADLYDEDSFQENLQAGDLTQYMREISETVGKEHCAGEETRGLMHYFDKDREIAGKVMSAYPGVAEIKGELYGVLECKISQPLSEKDICVLKDYWTGQMSDGWGESFEQHPIAVEEGELYVSFWSSDVSWRVMTEEELTGGQAQGMEMPCQCQ